MMRDPCRCQLYNLLYVVENTSGASSEMSKKSTFSDSFYFVFASCLTSKVDTLFACCSYSFDLYCPREAAVLVCFPSGSALVCEIIFFFFFALVVLFYICCCKESSLNGN
jgi:hypothetical protein